LALAKSAVAEALVPEAWVGEARTREPSPRQTATTGARTREGVELNFMISFEVGARNEVLRSGVRFRATKQLCVPEAFIALSTLARISSVTRSFAR
jgi:hypothetical protein